MLQGYAAHECSEGAAQALSPRLYCVREVARHAPIICCICHCALTNSQGPALPLVCLFLPSQSPPDQHQAQAAVAMSKNVFFTDYVPVAWHALWRPAMACSCAKFIRASACKQQQGGGKAGTRGREARGHSKSIAHTPALHPSQAPAPALRTLTQPLTHWSLIYLLHHLGSISSTEPAPLTSSFSPYTPLPYISLSSSLQANMHVSFRQGVRLQLIQIQMIWFCRSVQGVSAPPPCCTSCTMQPLINIMQSAPHLARHAKLPPG